ncbi:hypothetical protein C1646_757644 [Rhizophagus diaphanus]|nr:hypothetical protein C1646_757644 [Rhizophagus diaphanus] [Rhizophagus sp. MUCL 43196]
MGGPIVKGYGLNDKGFQVACHAAAKYWQLTYEKSEKIPLVSLAIKLFSITSSETGYELDEYNFDDNTSEDSESSNYMIRSTLLDISS